MRATRHSETTSTSIAGTWIEVTSTKSPASRCTSLIQRAHRPTPRPRSTDIDGAEASGDAGKRARTVVVVIVAVVAVGMVMGDEWASRPSAGVGKIVESDEDKVDHEDEDEDESAEIKEEDGDDEDDVEERDDEEDHGEKSRGRRLAGHDRADGAGDKGGVPVGDSGGSEIGEPRVVGRGAHASTLVGSRSESMEPRSARCERAHEARLRHTDRGEWPRRTPWRRSPVRRRSALGVGLRTGDGDSVWRQRSVAPPFFVVQQSPACWCHHHKG